MKVKVAEGLPEKCFHERTSTGETVLIVRGEKGHHVQDMHKFRDPDELNKELGVTKAQSEAMYTGSLFGWHIPAADPSRYDENGDLKAESIETLRKEREFERKNITHIYTLSVLRINSNNSTIISHGVEDTFFNLSESVSFIEEEAEERIENGHTILEQGELMLRVQEPNGVVISYKMEQVKIPD